MVPLGMTNRAKERQSVNGDDGRRQPSRNTHDYRLVNGDEDFGVADRRRAVEAERRTTLGGETLPYMTKRTEEEERTVGKISRKTETEELE